MSCAVRYHDASAPGVASGAVDSEPGERAQDKAPRRYRMVGEVALQSVAHTRKKVDSRRGGPPHLVTCPVNATAAAAALAPLVLTPGADPVAIVNDTVDADWAGAGGARGGHRGRAVAVESTCARARESSSLPPPSIQGLRCLTALGLDSVELRHHFHVVSE